jgi:hypothetical protein
MAEAAHDCPRAPTAVVERFIGADCAACWGRDAGASASGAWTLDWIVPGAQGDNAPLALAALPEAKARAQRGRLRAASNDTLAHRTALKAPRGTSLVVATGPAWHGYLGVQLDLGGRWPAGSSAWVALVEAVPQGTDGTPVARQLVRNVAGPIRIDNAEPTQRDTRAMRWPESAQPQRLVAAAWVEAADGRMLAFARDRCASP